MRLCFGVAEVWTGRQGRSFKLKRALIIVGMGILSFLFGSRGEGQATAPKEGKNSADVGRELRRLMLTTTAEKVGEKPSKEFPRVFGVLMDFPIGENTATIFSTSVGAASLYTTSTFGIIGGEG